MVNSEGFPVELVNAVRDEILQELAIEIKRMMPKPDNDGWMEEGGFQMRDDILKHINDKRKFYQESVK